jgi:hypothetical protein
MLYLSLPFLNATTFTQRNLSLYFASVACPFPTATGPCFVVGGGLTVFGDDASEGGLLWVDEVIFAELQLRMNTGELEAALQPEHPEITAIRYIPLGTELPNAPSPNPNETTDETIFSTNNAALSWVLVGVGSFLLIAVFAYMFISRRREIEEEERNASIQVGAFPVRVSQTNVARAHSSQRGSFNKAANTFNKNQRGKYSYAHSSKLESNRNLSESDSEDEGVALHVFHDDDNSPRRIPEGISTSWRDQILRIPTEVSHSQPVGSGTSISLDPNQPLVRPILDDEQVSHMLSFPSMDHQSSAEFTMYHSATSRDQDTFASPREHRKSPTISRLSPQDLFSSALEYHSPEVGAKSDTGSSLSSSPRHRSPSKREII